MATSEQAQVQAQARTFTLYVCEACGHYGFHFGSQHSIPLRCDPEGEHPEDHRGPYQEVEVAELAPIADEFERWSANTRAFAEGQRTLSDQAAFNGGAAAYSAAAAHIRKQLDAA